MGKRFFIEVRYKVKPGLRGEFVEKIKAAGIAEASRKESGNGRYEFLIPAGEPNRLVLLEVWNTEADQKAHTKTDHFQAFIELKNQYVTDTQVRTGMYDHESQAHYIASCIFTAKYPELSQKIQAYVTKQFGIPIVRCCVPGYRLEYFVDQMGPYGENWADLPDCGDYAPGDTVYSICHNCSAIIEEHKKNVWVKSLWELILEDENFDFPDYKRAPITIQDCWRAKGRHEEHEAVRALLRQMNFDIHELPDNLDETEFCGVSLYRPSPKRNLQLAPNRYVKNAAGKFIPHTKEQQIELMQTYGQRFETPNVADYCHYCHEGLELGGVNAFHLAALLFEPEECKKKIIW